MAIKVGDVFVKVGFDTTDFDKNLKGIGNKMNKVGKDLSMKVTAPLALFGGLAIKTAADFSKSMAKVNAVTGATSDEFKALNTQAKELGATTQFTSTQTADAMRFMGMAGQDANEIMAALPATLNLAAAGTLDMSTAANISTNILAGFGMEVSELGFAVDVLAKAFTSSNVDLVQLGDSMKFAGPVAKGFGLSFAETTAIMGSFGNAGIQGSLAGTSLRGAIVQLDKKAHKFGITMRDTTGKMLPMADILEQLEKTGLTTSEAMELFGLRAGPAMVALLDTGSDALRSFTAELEGSGGTAEQIAKTQMKGLHGALIILQSAFESLQIAIAQILTPILTPVLEWATKAFRAFDKLPGPVKTTAVVVGILAASIGPLLISMSLMIKGYLAAKVVVVALNTKLIALRATMVASRIAMMGMLGPIGLVVGLVGGAVATFLHFSKNTKTATDRLMDMKSALQDLNSKATTTKTEIAAIEQEISILAWEGTKDAIEKIVELQKALDTLRESAAADEAAILSRRDAFIAEKAALEETLEVFRASKHAGSENMKKAMIDLLNQINLINVALGEEDEALKRAAFEGYDRYVQGIIDTNEARDAELVSMGQSEDSLDALIRKTGDATRAQGVQNEALRIAESRLDTATDRFNDATEAVADFERQIADANRELNALSAPRLEGMQEFEDQLAAIDLQLKGLELEKLLAPESAREAIQEQIDALREQEQIIRLQQDIKFDPLIRATREATEEIQGLNKEIAPQSAMDRISELGTMLSDEGELGKGLKEAKAQLNIEEEAMELQQSIVDHFTNAVRIADTRLNWLVAQSEGHANTIIDQANAAAAAWMLASEEMKATGTATITTPKTTSAPLNFGDLPKNAKGGTIPGPTGLFNLKTRKFYGTAGESGSEQILPHGAGSGPMTLVVERLQLNIDGSQLIDVLGEAQVAAIRQDQALKI